MTDEDTFQAALDANPDDHVARGALGDWLCDRDDPRGPGYQALAAMRFDASFLVSNEGFTWFAVALPYLSGNNVPVSWFRLIKGGKCLSNKGSEIDRRDKWVDFHSRREAEDAAALAFSRLPPARQAELLTPQPVGAS